MTLKQLEASGLKAVRQLRENKLSNGQPFMINSPLLPFNQCYLEYPDGSIIVATINKCKTDFEIIKSLSHDEIKILRKKYRL